MADVCGGDHQWSHCRTPVISSQSSVGIPGNSLCETSGGFIAIRRTPKVYDKGDIHRLQVCELLSTFPIFRWTLMRLLLSLSMFLCVHCEGLANHRTSSCPFNPSKPVDYPGSTPQQPLIVANFAGQLNRSQSEDCLTLNVWSKLGGRRDKPVFVFFHGGSEYNL